MTLAHFNKSTFVPAATHPERPSTFRARDVSSLVARDQKGKKRDFQNYTPVNKHSLAIENGRFEEGFPIKHGDVPASYVIVYQRVLSKICKVAGDDTKIRYQNPPEQ